MSHDINKDHVKKDRVRLLVDALRSGEFRQGEGRLKKADDTYCCLGVACVVAMRNGLGISEWVRTPDADGSISHDFGDPKGDYSCSTLPHDVMRWYGFDVTAPYLEVDTFEARSRVVSSIWANDVGKWSFSKIADAFERTYLGTIPGKG